MCIPPAVKTHFVLYKISEDPPISSSRVSNKDSVTVRSSNIINRADNLFAASNRLAKISNTQHSLGRTMSPEAMTAHEGGRRTGVHPSIKRKQTNTAAVLTSFEVTQAIKSYEQIHKKEKDAPCTHSALSPYYELCNTICSDYKQSPASMNMIRLKTLNKLTGVIKNYIQEKNDLENKYGSNRPT